MLMLHGTVLPGTISTLYSQCIGWGGGGGGGLIHGRVQAVYMDVYNAIPARGAQFQPSIFQKKRILSPEITYVSQQYI